MSDTNDQVKLAVTATDEASDTFLAVTNSIDKFAAQFKKDFLEAGKASDAFYSQIEKIGAEFKALADKHYEDVAAGLVDGLKDIGKEMDALNSKRLDSLKDVFDSTRGYKDQASKSTSSAAGSAASSAASSAVSGLLGPVAGIAAGITAGAVAMKAFQQVAAGAGITFENELTKKVDEASEKAFALTDHLGEALKNASMVLPESSWLSVLLSKAGDVSGGLSGVADLAGAFLRDVGANAAKPVGEGFNGEGTRSAADAFKNRRVIDVGLEEETKGMNRDDAIKHLRGRQKTLQDEARALGKDGRIMNIDDHTRNNQITARVQSINDFIQHKYSTDPGAVLKGLTGGFQQNTAAETGKKAARKVLGDALAGGTAPADKSPFTKAFGSPTGIISGIVGAAKKKHADELDKDKDNAREREEIRLRNRTADEKFGEGIAHARDVYGGDVFNKDFIREHDRLKKIRDDEVNGGKAKDTNQGVHFAESTFTTRQHGVNPLVGLAKQQLAETKLGRVALYKLAAAKERQAVQDREAERRANPPSNHFNNGNVF
jgi:hypothetical protein